MTPRERAEALGWTSTPKGTTWWRPARFPYGLVSVVYEESHDSWVYDIGGSWGRLPTEDDALAHALLLRDVVLS